ncbi:UNVERIFIED_ORG: hypothetical protein ABID33_002212 [Xanthobacter viscosus]|uniref:Uncharacterized protein n=1 Tax=Xanthobacter autotrophicus TaxID=280 RepID=A0A6C1KB77_XANAU|nr:hypothetical protein [Xanthobacter autotrophicus]TLX41352.1 hypothetical protein FBQ73_17915 [Xanthobacter autotrophicus]
MDGESDLSDVEVRAPSAEVWRGRRVHWQDRATWFGALETWLEREWRSGGKARLQKRKLDLCWDDSDWLVALDRHVQPSIETLIEELADDLANAKLRTFHGCRVPDAGVFHREGLRRNEPAELEALARRLVAEDDDLAWMRPKIEGIIAGFEDRERDTGRLYVCADERPQLDRSGQYLLFGSEWLQCLLGRGAHRALKRYGTPTVVEVDLPFDWASKGTRREFARHLLQEWTRVFVKGETFSPALDFSVILLRDIPAEMVVGHSHPRVLKNPFMQYRTERTANPTCPHCVGSAKA